MSIAPSLRGAPPVAIMAEPKWSATVVGAVKCGEEVRTLSSDQSAWTKIVTPGGIEGYITSSVLTPVESKGNIASGALRVGGPVTAPRAVYAPDTEYPEEPRKAHYQGVCWCGQSLERMEAYALFAFRVPWVWAWTKRHWRLFGLGNSSPQRKMDDQWLYRSF